MSENQPQPPQVLETTQPETQGEYEFLLADVDRIKKRQRLSKRQLNENIDNIIKNLEKAENELEDSADEMEEEEENNENDITDSVVELLHNNLVNLKPLKNIYNSHKEYFAYLSKIGKDIEKVFNKDLNILSKENNFEPQLMHRIIADFFQREQQFELCDLLQKETGTQINQEQREILNNIQRISSGLEKKELTEAIQWANTQCRELQLMGSKLLFFLHKQKYISLIQQQKRDEAIEYARQYFLQFCDYQTEIQKLMAVILYIGKTAESPYSDLFEENNWVQLKDLFVNNACKIYNVPPQSALLISTIAGTLSLPKFLKLQQILDNNKELNKNNKEIGIDFEYGNQFKFHSIFVCPVSREPADPNQPPQLLRCGHVISKGSLDKIIAGSENKRFKCPTCQNISKKCDAKEIYY